MKTVNITVNRKRMFKKSLPLYLLALPSLIYIFFNNYMPMAYLLAAFKNVDFRVGIWASEWSGFDNFKYLFSTKDAFIITRNTVLYNVAFIIIGMVVSLAFAIILSEMKAKRMSKLYRSLLLLPYLFSMVIVSYMVYAFLSSSEGFMNNTVLPLLGAEKISWYSDPTYWPFILVFINVWKGAGYSCVIYLASIMGVDPEYNEAASLDGATIMQRIRYITLPLIRPSIIMLLLMSIGKIFYSDFGLFYQVTQNSGALYDVTNVIDTYVFNALMKLGDIGMSAAAGLYQSLVGFVLVLGANWVARKVESDGALF